MKLDKLRQLLTDVDNLQAACISHVYDEDTTVYHQLRTAFRAAFATYIRAARLALRQAGGVVVGFPCVPWRNRR